jgi:hypothetical protein
MGMIFVLMMKSDDIPGVLKGIYPQGTVRGRLTW